MREEKASKPPAWFGEMIAMAQHKDTINSWPRFYRWLHRWLVPCPACRKIREREKTARDLSLGS